MNPNLFILPPCQQDSSLIIVVYSWKSFKVYTLPEEEFLGKPKDFMGDIKKVTKEVWNFWHLSYSKYWTQAATSLINIKPHTKHYICQLLLPNTTHLALNRKLHSRLKKSKCKHNLKRQVKYQNQNQIWQTLELSIRKFKETMINIMVLMEKVDTTKNRWMM